MGISVPAVVLATQSACGVDGDVTLLKSLALLDKDYGTIRATQKFIMQVTAGANCMNRWPRRRHRTAMRRMAQIGQNR